jgi:hypothetical protein
MFKKIKNKRVTNSFAKHAIETACENGKPYGGGSYRKMLVLKYS